jgi:hypothetical protein
MSIHKIQRSMEMILEGIDSLDAPLILEASGEFENGVDELKKNLEGFIKVCKPFNELEIFTKEMERGLETLNNMDLDKVPTKYSFADHYQMQSSTDPDNNQGLYSVSLVALQYPQYVSAIRDSILEIAKWLEQYPEVFSVGKNGIVFSGKFRGVIANTDLKINDFAQSGDEIVTLMSGIDDSSSEKTDLKAHYASIWKKEGLEPDKEDDEWKNFVAAFDTIASGAQKAFDNAGNAIKGVKPPKEIQDSSKKSGGMLKSVLGSIFGGGASKKAFNAVSQEPKYIIGESLNDDQFGIFAMTFQDLQKLIASVIEYSGSSAAAGANALAGIDSHQKETMKPSPGQVKTIEKIQDISKNLGTEDVTKIGAEMEDAGMKDGDTSKIDVSKLKKHLMKQFKNDEVKVNAILDGLELEDTDTEEETGTKNPLDVITDLSKVGDEFKDTLIDLSIEEELMDSSGEVTPPNSKAAVDGVIEVAEDELEEEEQEELRASLKPSNESRLRETFDRWSLLAGTKMDN